VSILPCRVESARDDLDDFTDFVPPIPLKQPALENLRRDEDWRTPTIER
jgi:hypothetical protein